MRVRVPTKSSEEVRPPTPVFLAKSAQLQIKQAGCARLLMAKNISDAEPLALTGVVVAEVLQGLTRDAGPIEQYLAQFDLLEPGGFRTYREAAANFSPG